MINRLVILRADVTSSKVGNAKGRYVHTLTYVLVQAAIIH